MDRAPTGLHEPIRNTALIVGRRFQHRHISGTIIVRPKTILRTALYDRLSSTISAHQETGLYRPLCVKGHKVPQTSAFDLLYALTLRLATTSTTNLGQQLRPSRIFTVRRASLGITARLSQRRYQCWSRSFDRSILKDSEQPSAVWRDDKLEREHYRNFQDRAGICVLGGPFTRYLSLHCLQILSTLSLSTRAPTFHITPLSYEPPRCPSWIPSLHVDRIGPVLTSPLRHLQRHSCNHYPVLLHPKPVGHQDLPGTQPPSWLLPWLIRLPCILGLTQWVHLPALQHGGLMPSNWVVLSSPHHRCTNIPSPTP